MNSSAMSRPRYETEEDLLREKALACKLAATLQLEARKLSCAQYGADYFLYRPERKCGGISGNLGEPRYWIEIKWRTISSTAFSHYMVGLGKFRRLLELQEKHVGTKSMLVIRFTDIVLWCDITARTAYIRGVGKRGEMRDAEDLEPMAFIPMEMFRRITCD